MFLTRFMLPLFLSHRLQTATEVAAILGIKRIGIDHGLCEVLQKRNVSMRPSYLSSDELPSEDPFLASW